MHAHLPPSPWIARWAHLLPPAARVLDVACGSGRHVHHLQALGHHVTALDRDAQALAGLEGLARVVCADIENGPWPLTGEHFDAVVVTNYLWRPLWPQLLAALDEGGVLLYETFAHGNASVGKPSRPDFLLQPAELWQACAGLHVVAYENGFLTAPERYVQRICALHLRPADSAGAVPRHMLVPPLP